MDYGSVLGSVGMLNSLECFPVLALESVSKECVSGTKACAVDNYQDACA